MKRVWSLKLTLFKGRRNRPVAIMVHDGYVWHGSVFALKRKREWMLRDDTFVNGGNPLQLPEELTAWAAGAGCEADAGADPARAA